jgi:hypothetical protein
MDIFELLTHETRMRSTSSSEVYRSSISFCFSTIKHIKKSIDLILVESLPSKTALGTMNYTSVNQTHWAFF